MGVGGVGLAALAGGEDPDTRRELRRHIEDLLAGSKQPDRDVMADPVAALDRPHAALGIGLDRVDVTHHRGKPSLVGVETTTTKDGLIAAHHLDRRRPLVRIHPDHDTLCLLLHAPSRCSIPAGCRVGKGNATSSWANPS